MTWLCRSSAVTSSNRDPWTSEPGGAIAVPAPNRRADARKESVVTSEAPTNPLTRVAVFLLGTGAIALVALYLLVLADTAKPGLPAGWVFGVAGAAAWVVAHAYSFGQPTRRIRFVFAPAGAGKLIQLGALAALAAALLIVS